MRYDVIPSFYDLFNNDKFCLPEYPGCEELAYALSFFGYLYTEKDTMNKTFFEESVGVVGIDVDNAKAYLNNKVLITEYGVLAAWKLIFKFYKKNQVYRHERLDISFNILYRLIVQEQEKYLNDFEKVSIKNSIMTNSFLGYLDNLSSALARSYYLFIKNKGNFLKYKGYSEIFEKFNNEYQIDVNSYLQALYVLIFCKCESNYQILKEHHDMTNNNFVISQIQIKTKETQEKVMKALKILSFDYLEASEWAEKAYKDKLDFSLFQEKPIYKLNGDYYLPITRKFLQDQVFLSLIYKMRKLYPEKNKSFFILMGKLFEDYLTYIFRQVIKTSKVEYELIPEFIYGGKRKRKESPDVIVCWENDAYVFEFKAARVLNRINKLDNEIDLEDSIDRVIREPISQAIQRVNEIISGKVKNELNETKNYYFVAVTMSNFPIHYSKFDMIKEQLKNINFKICGMYNLSVEEYELLCDATLKQKKHLGFFFDEFRYEYPNDYSFKNYIRQYTKGTASILFSEFEKDMRNFIDNIEL